MKYGIFSIYNAMGIILSYDEFNYKLEIDILRNAS